MWFHPMEALSYPCLSSGMIQTKGQRKIMGWRGQARRIQPSWPYMEDKPTLITQHPSHPTITHSTHSPLGMYIFDYRDLTIQNIIAIILKTSICAPVAFLPNIFLFTSNLSSVHTLVEICNCRLLYSGMFVFFVFFSRPGLQRIS